MLDTEPSSAHQEEEGVGSSERQFWMVGLIEDKLLADLDNSLQLAVQQDQHRIDTKGPPLHLVSRVFRLRDPARCFFIPGYFMKLFEQVAALLPRSDSIRVWADGLKLHSSHGDDQSFIEVLINPELQSTTTTPATTGAATAATAGSGKGGGGVSASRTQGFQVTVAIYGPHFASQAETVAPAEAPPSNYSYGADAAWVLLDRIRAFLYAAPQLWGIQLDELCVNASTLLHQGFRALRVTDLVSITKDEDEWFSSERQNCIAIKKYLVGYTRNLQLPSVDCLPVQLVGGEKQRAAYLARMFTAPRTIATIPTDPPAGASAGASKGGVDEEAVGVSVSGALAVLAEHVESSAGLLQELRGLAGSVLLQQDEQQRRNMIQLRLLSVQQEEVSALLAAVQSLRQEQRLVARATGLAAHGQLGRLDFPLFPVLSPPSGRLVKRFRVLFLCPVCCQRAPSGPDAAGVQRLGVAVLGKVLRWAKLRS